MTHWINLTVTSQRWESHKRRRRTAVLVQFTVSRIIVSFKFLGDLQNYTFFESLEPTEPEK